MYLLPAQQLPVEVTHPVRLVSLSFIVLRPRRDSFRLLSSPLVSSRLLPPLFYLSFSIPSCHPGLGRRFIPTPQNTYTHTHTHTRTPSVVTTAVVYVVVVVLVAVVVPLRRRRVQPG